MPTKEVKSSPHAAARREQRRSRRVRARFRARLRVEELESRTLLSATVTAAEPDGTLDLARDLGDVGGGATVSGNIGDGGAADVDWFRFTLAHAARVTVFEGPVPGSGLVGVVGVYNEDPWSFADPENAAGHRLLAQASGGEEGGEVSLEQTLAAGTYWLAVSGLGNGWFHPFLEGSGHAGSTGDYELSLVAVEVASDPSVPAVLGSTPAEGAVVDRSPLVVRINYDAPLDTGVIDLGATQLVYSPTEDFADPDAQAVLLGAIAFSSQANELQLVPAAPLRPGYYSVFLADGSTEPILRFQVTGIEGADVSDDGPGTANEMGDLSAGDVIQAAGAIGDDGTYDLNSDDPLLLNPAADVDLYHFRIVGAGTYAFTAEVFAGRIGSRLDAGVSLFRRDADGFLHFIDGNDNTLNAAVSTNGMVPLYTDAALFVGLTAGDYFLAVAGGPNTPQRALNTSPGVDGIFDPNTPQSGYNGFTVGPYVLNLSLRADDVAPEVVAVTPAEGETLAAPPTRVNVTFSEPVNLGVLAYIAFQQTYQSALAPVFVLGPAGERYYPRLESYDEAAGVAVFLLLDGLGNGDYELHLSAGEGLADFAGNGLVGNDPTGDFVTRFTVAGPERGSAGDATLWETSEPNDDVLAPQDLGVLFAHELQAGVTVVRDFTLGQQQAPADGADYFRFAVLQDRVYQILLDTTALPPGVTLSLFDALGNEVPAAVTDNGAGLQAQLAAGTYVVGVSEWSALEAGDITYSLRIVLAESGDNPAPLTVGPSPVSTTRLVGMARTVTPGRIAATTLVDLPDGGDPSRLPAPLLPPTLSREVETAAGTADDAVTGADLQPALAAIASLLIASPATIGNFTDTSTPESISASAADASFGKAGVPAGLLASLGAGAVGGVEEDAPRVIDPDTTEAKAPDPRLSDDLLPRGGPSATAKPTAAVPVAQAGATWVAQLWESWCKHAAEARAILLEDADPDPARVLSAPAEVSGDEPASDGLLWMWAPAVAAFVAVNLALHRRSITSALTPALADLRGSPDEPMP